MNIGFFGSSLVSAFWNGAATYYRGILSNLAARGHTITFYEPDAYERQQHRDIEDPDWARVVVYPASPEAALQTLASAAHADLIVKASGIGVNDELLDEAVPDVRRPGQMVAYWDVDAPATLDRLAQNRFDSFHCQIKRYDVVFTYGGGEPVASAYRSFGARACIPIYNALDPRTHHLVNAVPEWGGDLSFLGNRLPDREARVEEFFIRPAESLPDRTFVLGGNGWADKVMPRNVRAVGHVYTRDHNAFNCSAVAVLNISRESMARYGFSPATRVFEAAGAGACLITDAWEGIELFLEPEREILVARDGDEVSAILERLTPARAREIGSVARRRVLAHHTYAHRAAQFDAVMKGNRFACAS